jgi:hypothetical protein
MCLIQGDVNGDGKADFEIELSGLHVLSALDFLSAPRTAW